MPESRRRLDDRVVVAEALGEAPYAPGRGEALRPPLEDDSVAPERLCAHLVIGSLCAAFEKKGCDELERRRVVSVRSARGKDAERSGQACDLGARLGAEPGSQDRFVQENVFRV